MICDEETTELFSPSSSSLKKKLLYAVWQTCTTKHACHARESKSSLRLSVTSSYLHDTVTASAQTLASSRHHIYNNPWSNFNVFFFVWFPLKLQQLHSLELFCKDNSCSVTPFSLKVPTNTCGDVEKEEPTLQLEG